MRLYYRYVTSPNLLTGRSKQCKHKVGLAASFSSATSSYSNRHSCAPQQSNSSLHFIDTVILRRPNRTCSMRTRWASASSHPNGTRPTTRPSPSLHPLRHHHRCSPRLMTCPTGPALRFRPLPVRSPPTTTPPCGNHLSSFLTSHAACPTASRVSDRIGMRPAPSFAPAALFPAPSRWLSHHRGRSCSRKV